MDLDSLNGDGISRTESDTSPPYPLGAYIVVGTLGMFLWEILINLGSEYKLLLKRRIGLPTIVYYWARINTFAGLVGAVLFFTVPLGRYCTTISKAILIGISPFVTSETLLLFFRLRAVYWENRRMVIGFFVSFLVVTGCSTLIPFAGAGYRIGPSNPYCTANMNARLAEAMLLIPLLNHIAVFIAISVRLSQLNSIKDFGSSPRKGLVFQVKAFWRGKHLPLLSKTVLQDGQIYILIFILTTIATSIMMAIGRLNVIYRFILIAPHAAIENSMNSYLFRSVRATLLPTQDVTTPTLHFRPNTDGSVDEESRGGDNGELVR
ncbi:hypothetical protein Moror_16534 [Moniliophthora roreri MCA 2997]|uniref:DUF6533 domain-containing protein n=2 Tax=Moniliophthora roreri TaxID=221103 RepID=V2WVE4_MONRO|nr:hypothetical protein Moror_16534 [Moniliophthora roreri MCA 2997]KAI3616882.1 hypothetical protein WG66_004371 [Moniliophthora roreri]